MDDVIRINLLGPPQVLRGSRPIEGWRSRKALALLAYLALHDGPAPRLALADLLWPASDEVRARANLSWALSHVNGLLSHCLTGDRHAVAYAPENPTLQLDTEKFARLRRHNTVEALEQAVALVQGELLEGFTLHDCPDFELWLVGERERWRRLTADAWSALIAHHRFAGNYDAAVSHARRLLAYIPWQESAHRNLMLVLALSGRRSAALAQYETCRRLLSEELGVEPSAETARLYAAIRDGDEAQVAGWPGEADLPALSARAGKPAVSAVAPRHNLPRQYSSFVGREQELSTIGRRLEEPETALITVAGPGGVGKTRLALAAAAAQIGRFADGVFFVPLAPLTAVQEIAPAMAEALNFPFDAGSGAPPLEEQLLAWLANREMLLVLDNLEHLAGASDLLWRLLDRAPRAKMLVTSRHHLNLHAEVLIEIDGLPFPAGEDEEGLASLPSMSLFVERTRRRRHDYELTSGDLAMTARLCRLLAGNPLALELAASMAATEPLDKLAAQVAADLDTLQTTAGDVPRRQTSLRAVFFHSWNLLSGEQQQALASLVVFRGGFTGEAFTAVSSAADPVLLQLVGRSLVQAQGSGRFDLHPLIRQYLHETHDQASLRGAAGRHSGHYLSLVRELSPRLLTAGQGRTMARLRREQENWIAAWDYALALPDLPALRAASADLLRYWQAQHHFRAGVEFFERAAGVLAEQQPVLARMMSLRALGCIQWENYRAEHWEAAQVALSVVRGRVSVEELAAAVLMAGRCATYLTGNTDTVANDLLAEAADRMAALHDDEGLVEVWILRGFLAQQLADFAESQRWYQQAAEALQRRGDASRLAFVRFRQARAAFLADSFAEAGALAGESLALYTRFEDRRGALDCLVTLGLAAYGAGQLDEAAGYFEDGLPLAEHLGNRVRVANNLNNLGAIAVEQGRYDDAHRWYDRSLAVFGELGDRSGLALVFNNLGMLAEARGDLPEAQRNLLASLADRQNSGELRSLVITRINLGFVLEASGETGEAVAHFDVALQAGIEKNVEGWMADALAGIALARMDAGHLDQGISLAGLVLASTGLSPYARRKLEARLGDLRAEFSEEWLDWRLAMRPAQDIRTIASDIHSMPGRLQSGALNDWVNRG